MPLLPTFQGMENENPYTHIRDFDEVCTTFKESAFDMDFLKMKAFPLTLKDKVKIWLNSLRPRTIRNWAELQAEFLKKFFSAHKTNKLKRKIYTFAAHDSERFIQCWERYLETISTCPHHGFDTWMLVNHFYDGMSPSMKRLLETMCRGDFLSKNPDKAMDFLNYVAETSKGWDEPNPREVERMKPTKNSRGGIYALTEEVELKAKLSTLNRRMEDLEQRNNQEVRAVAEATAPSQPCFNCQSTGHQWDNCPVSPSVRDLMIESVSIVGHNRPPTDTSLVILITPTGRTTQIWPGSLNPLYMSPHEQISSNSMDPILSSSIHQLILINTLFVHNLSWRGAFNNINNQRIHLNLKGSSRPCAS